MTPGHAIDRSPARAPWPREGTRVHVRLADRTVAGDVIDHAWHPSWNAHDDYDVIVAPLRAATRIHVAPDAIRIPTHLGQSPAGRESGW